MVRLKAFPVHFALLLWFSIVLSSDRLSKGAFGVFSCMLSFWLSFQGFRRYRVGNRTLHFCTLLHFWVVWAQLLKTSGFGLRQLTAHISFTICVVSTQPFLPEWCSESHWATNITADIVTHNEAQNSEMHDEEERGKAGQKSRGPEETNAHFRWGITIGCRRRFYRKPWDTAVGLGSQKSWVKFVYKQTCWEIRLKTGFFVSFDLTSPLILPQTDYSKPVLEYKMHAFLDSVNQNRAHDVWIVRPRNVDFINRPNYKDENTRVPKVVKGYQTMVKCHKKITKHYYTVENQ